MGACLVSQSRREEFTADVADLFAELRGSWMGSLVLTVFLLPVVAVVARGLATVGLLTPGVAGPVVVATILGTVCVVQFAGLVVGSVRTVSGRSADVWRHGNTLSVLLSLGLYVETFAVVTACVWRAAGQEVGALGGLWQAESFYLWHVLHAIPVLDITGTIGWREPAFAAAHAPAGLILAFQVVIIPQLLRAAIGGYRFAVGLATSRDTRVPAEEGRSRWWAPRLAVGVVAGVCVAAAGVTWIAVQTLDRGSAFSRWWLDDALTAIHAVGSPAEKWAVAAPAIVLLLAAVFPLYLVVFSTGGLSGQVLPNARSWWTTGMVLVAAVAEVYGIMLWDAGLLITLSRLGLGVHLPDTAGTLTVLETLVWHVVHMLPGPDVTGLLGWNAPYTVDGGFAGWLLLSLKAFVVAVIVFLGLPVVRTAVVRSRFGPVVDVWGAALAASSRAAAAPLTDDVFAFGDWGSYRRRREYLDRAARDLTSVPRFAELVPALNVLLDALPGGGAPASGEHDPALAKILDSAPDNLRKLSPEERAGMAAALLAFRATVIDAFPGAAAAVAERPDWLTSEDHAGAVVRMPPAGEDG
jgi:hypothetical protein